MGAQKKLGVPIPEVYLWLFSIPGWGSICFFLHTGGLSVIFWWYQWFICSFLYTGGLSVFFWWHRGFIYSFLKTVGSSNIFSWFRGFIPDTARPNLDKMTDNQKRVNEQSDHHGYVSSWYISRECRCRDWRRGRVHVWVGRPATTPVQNGRGWTAWSHPNEQLGFLRQSWHGDTVPCVQRQAVSAPWATPCAVPSLFASSSMYFFFGTFCFTFFYHLHFFFWVLNPHS